MHWNTSRDVQTTLCMAKQKRCTPFFLMQCRALAKRLALAEKSREALSEEVKVANQNVTRLQVGPLAPRPTQRPLQSHTHPPPTNHKGLIVVPRSRNARTHYVVAEPSLRPPQGPDVRLPKIVTFPRGDAEARAVIGPLT